MVLEWIVIALASVPMVVYVVSRLRFTNPNIRVTIAGQQSGDPIPLPAKSGTLMVGVSTEGERDIVLWEAQVWYSIERL